jgi:multidrug resistance efflux pump
MDILSRLFARVGFVRRQQHEQLRMALRRAEAQLRRLEKTGDELKKNFDAAKAKAHDAVLRAKRAEQRARRLEKILAERTGQPETSVQDVTE